MSRNRRPAPAPARADTPPAPTPAPAPPTVRVEGLADTLHDVRHELQLLGHATKFNWINHRLILLRNAVIALSVLVVVITFAVVCAREAYRQTLTVAAFEVPPSLAQQGLSGQVVAKALFDELVKRRDLVTTLEAGELRGAWAENRADVAIPEAKFTLQSLFRYLRYMTGNEIAVDGEIVLEGDAALFKVRVAGRPPTVVRGPLTSWQGLVGELANGVLGATQPAVLAGTLGAQAKTSDDLRALSKFIVDLRGATPRPSNAVLAVAYDAYGSALQRLGRPQEALAAFTEAMQLDPSNGVAVVNAANAQFARRNYVEASALNLRAQSLQLPEPIKARSLQARIGAAINVGDCPAAAQALRDAKASAHFDAASSAAAETAYLTLCEFEEARAVALIERYAVLHPSSLGPMNTLGTAQMLRPEGRYREAAIATFRRALEEDPTNPLLNSNLAYALAQQGDLEAAQVAYQNGRTQRDRAGTQERLQASFDAFLHVKKGEYTQAEASARRFLAVGPAREQSHFELLGSIQTGLRRFDEAARVYREGLALLPKNCQLWADFGAMHVKAGDPAAALATHAQGITAVPKCGLNYNAAARLLITQQKPAEAREKLNALIAVAPQSDGAVIAKEILAGMGR